MFATAQIDFSTSISVRKARRNQFLEQINEIHVCPADTEVVKHLHFALCGIVVCIKETYMLYFAQSGLVAAAAATGQRKEQEIFVPDSVLISVGPKRAESLGGGTYSERRLYGKIYEWSFFAYILLLFLLPVLAFHSGQSQSSSSFLRGL